MKRAWAWLKANYVSMQGRTSRKRCWQLYLPLFFLEEVAFALFLNITLTENPATLLLSGLSLFHLAFILALIYLLLIFWGYASIFMRRLNDMGVEENVPRFVIIFIALVSMLPIASTISQFVPILILGSLPGMKGQNQYGADPLG